MESIVAVFHVLIALILVILVLIQDSKGGGALGIGGGGTNSILGATGAQTLAAKLTRLAAVLFAVTCLTLTYLTSKGQKSVIDTGGVLPAATVPAAPPAAALPGGAPENKATPPAAGTPAAPEPSK